MSMLYIVATPLGNTGDASTRMLETLKAADVIAAEDTRVTGKLLGLLDIPKKEFVQLHQHSSSGKFIHVKKLLEDGKKVALVTDAGTPGIADPGGELISYITQHCPDVVVTAIPGPSAVIAALSISGFPADQFVFLGFPPHKNKRNKFFERTKELSKDFTVVLYESTHRIKKTLKKLGEVLFTKQEIMIGRELTKKFETVYRSKIEDLSDLKIKEKGEFVIVIKKL